MSQPGDRARAEGERTLLDRALGAFSDVRPGEGARALLMLANIFLILVCYYVIKTVREPLILTTEVPAFLQRLGIRGAAEIKSYAAAGQAIVLLGFIPAYSWFASRVDRARLIYGVTLFFVANIALFAISVSAEVRYVGVAFFIWVGFFNNAIIAQFWSYANDIYTQEAGDRLFPIIGIGMTGGSWVGPKIAEELFLLGVEVPVLLYLAGGLLLATLAIFSRVNRGSSGTDVATREVPLSRGGGFGLVFQSRYIGLLALLIILLNVVNTTGEYILSRLVEAQAQALAAADPGFDAKAFIGAFYGNFFFWVNTAALLLQAFVVSRLVKHFGLAGVLFALPLTSLVAYGGIGAGIASLALVRWLKTAENGTDYSVMNTARQLLWLPTTREEKYKAKQAIDTFFVRFGDVISALVVFAGTSWLALGVRGFSALNVGVVVVWLGVAAILLRENRRLTAAKAS